MRSPCDRVKPKDVIGKKALRTRILRDVEMRALWAATESMGYPYGPLIRLLVLTGQRKSEVSDARWSEFDLQRWLWTIPAERMKADAPHTVPLTAEAVAVLESLPRSERRVPVLDDAGTKRFVPSCAACCARSAPTGPTPRFCCAPTRPELAGGFPLSGLLSSDPIVTTGIISALSGLGNDRRTIQISAQQKRSECD